MSGVWTPWTDARVPRHAESDNEGVVPPAGFHDLQISVLKRVVIGSRVEEAYTDPTYELDAAMPPEGPLNQGWHLDAMPEGAGGASSELGFLGPRGPSLRAKVLFVVHSVDQTPVPAPAGHPPRAGSVF